MSARMPSFFDKPGLQLLLFGGKGGVGKTTCATAAALRMSALAPSRSLLLVSTDPAHSVRDSLAGHVPPDNLQVLELDAAAIPRRIPRAERPDAAGDCRRRHLPGR